MAAYMLMHICSHHVIMTIHIVSATIPVVVVVVCGDDITVNVRHSCTFGFLDGSVARSFATVKTL